ncbi:MAG: AraC family transcriptional regulator ligand-binding domain-containing protein, partial [Rhodocyclaceae bacterium]|nr:AraC family transcriptional regulator ligand-binding domain-containing protein [Rhodocyclaceae bacterium]
MVAAHRRYGSDPSAALARAGIDPAMLDDPSNRVTAEQMEVMSEASMRALDDEALGWFSQPL